MDSDLQGLFEKKERWEIEITESTDPDKRIFILTVFIDSLFRDNLLDFDVFSGIFDNIDIISKCPISNKKAILLVIRINQWLNRCNILNFSDYQVYIIPSIEKKENEVLTKFKLKLVRKEKLI